MTKNILILTYKLVLKVSLKKNKKLFINIIIQLKFYFLLVFPGSFFVISKR